MLIKKVRATKKPYSFKQNTVYNCNKTGSEQFKGVKVIGKLIKYPTENNQQSQC